MPIRFLEKLTIVIFSINRHKHLKRTIKYWSDYNVKLLVLDGSDAKLDDPCLNTKNIRYIYGPKDLYDRLLSSIGYIDTEFMMLGGDDEFYLASALSSCIKFLTKESAFSCCGGRAIGFHTYKKNIFGGKQYPKLKDLSLDNDSASERIESHFCNYVPAHVYSVIRSSKWKIICKHTCEKEFNFYAAFELQIEFLTIVSGKSKIISELMWMRNQEVPPVTGTRHSKFVKLSILEWWSDKRFKEEKEEFLYRMKKACEDLSANINFKYSEKMIANLFEVYINKLYKNQISEKNLFKKILNLISYRKILGLMSYGTKKLIKEIIRWEKISIYMKRSLEVEANLLEVEGVSVNYEDLNQVILALKYSKNEKLDT